MEKQARKSKSEKNTGFLTQSKFKPLKMHYNQLQSKYDVYKNGSPNVYEQNLESLKFHHIKNDLSVMHLPTIDYILKEIKNTPSQVGANKRDYIVHPSMSQKYANKFKDFTSDRQQIKDFLEWFKTKEDQIEEIDASPTKKFQLLQSLLASAFNEILNQICIVSRPRAEVLKKLWNKQVSEGEKIIEIMYKSGNQTEKKNLQTIKSLHVDYQQQIITLKSENYCMEKKVQELSMFNESCINTLRVMRKQAKKYEIIIKQLQEANCSLKEESLNLIEQNTKIMMKDKNISAQHARILTYRIMQSQNYRQKLKQKPKTKQIIKQIRNKSEEAVEGYELPDIQDRKQKLLSFIKIRAKQNPQEKLFILKGEFDDEQDEIIALDAKIEEYFCSKEIQNSITTKICKKSNFFIEKGVNTDQLESKKETQKSMRHIEIQTDEIYNQQETETPKKRFFSSAEDSQAVFRKLEESTRKKRNSLMMLQMDRQIEFKKNDFAVNIRRFSKLNENKYSSFQLYNDQMKEEIRYKSNIEPQMAYEHSNGESSDFLKKIQENHRNSLLLRKSRDLNDLIRKFQYEVQEKGQIASESSGHNKERSSEQKSRFFQRKTVPVKSMAIIDKKDDIEEFRHIIKKFIIKSQIENKVTSKHPEKHLKKILTSVYKSIYVSGKYNLLGELINVAKNCYGKIAYEDRLLQLVYILLQTKQNNSLLTVVSLLLRIKGYQLTYDSVNNDEVSELYFKIYFNLSLKNPNQNKFNLWNNYTNLNRINSSSFDELLRQYFSENKCSYLHLKIKQFIGIPTNEIVENNKIDGNYYVQMNSLMMYLLEVYLIEKKNYYESYHEFIDFLCEDDDGFKLETLLFVFDLLCFNQQDQKKLLQELFKTQKKEDSFVLRDKKKMLSSVQSESKPEKTNHKICSKDHFYRLCILYELPLFQFMSLLKYDQFKELPPHIYSRYKDYRDQDNWKIFKNQIQSQLNSKNKENLGDNYFIKLLEKLDNYIQKKQCNKDVFSFVYYILVLTAHQ